MSVIFNGNTNWIQRAPTLWQVDSWGVDHARILFRGRLTGKDAFENSLLKWGSMPGFPQMRLEGWNSIEMTPSFPGVELHYVGFKNGSVPQVRFTDGNSAQSAQGTGVDTATGANVSGTFIYRAERTTWTWFENAEPSTVPRYGTVRHLVDPMSNILGYSIQDDDTGKELNTIPFSAFVAVFNSLRRVMVPSSYEREMIIPNLVWACRADIDYKLLS